MSLKDKLKGIANYINPPKSPDQIEYEKNLKEATQKAHREAYLKESIKQSKMKAKAQAVKAYNPGLNSSPLGNVLLGSPSMPMTRKKSALKQKMKQDNSFNNLLWNS